MVSLLAAPQSQQMVLTGILSSSARMRSLLSMGSFLSDMVVVVAEKRSVTVAGLVLGGW